MEHTCENRGLSGSKHVEAPLYLWGSDDHTMAMEILKRGNNVSLFADIW
jgi:hypothetical protein